jgi:hypothetical protein
MNGIKSKNCHIHSIKFEDLIHKNIKTHNKTIINNWLLTYFLIFLYFCDINFENLIILINTI